MDRLRHQPLQDGFMEIAYGWAEEDMTTSTRGGRRFASRLDGSSNHTLILEQRT
jgi:hypothetical protein